MNDRQRPLYLKIICTIGFIGIIVGTLSIIFGLFQYEFIIKVLEKEGVSSWYVRNFITFSIFFNLAGLICCIGLWKMKKWGIYSYAATVFASQIINIEAGLSNIFSLILPAIAASLLLLKFSNNKAQNR